MLVFEDFGFDARRDAFGSASARGLFARGIGRNVLRDRAREETSCRCLKGVLRVLSKRSVAYVTLWEGEEIGIFKQKYAGAGEAGC